METLTTERAVTQAPGCFGAASVFSLDSQVCGQCVAYQECQRAAYDTLERIKTRINVSDLLTKHLQAKKKADEARAAAQAPAAVEPVAQPTPVSTPVERKTQVVRVSFDISADQEHLILKLKNGKCAELARALCKADVIRNIRPAILAGKNPFEGKDDKWLHMKVGCQMLLEGGFTYAGLKERLMSDNGWGEGTANSQRGWVRDILVLFDLVELKGDTYTFKSK
jgi:hypothetical protein